ncbi:MAG: bifunctional DNA-formamidopyrimidine glycosylase/DNA-(apurinic or apyrimidinic site) lyase [Sulfuriflexus sp.]|nr:bifunctional DNA-formamidopyrimidine glycosylase/DNA-(apurinic or apyrimidinic site) lyase [Sulfuriflexus sp.]
MPELPEVETTRVGISPHIQGQTVTSVIIRNGKLRWPIPTAIKKTLPKQKLLSVTRRGKYLLLEFPKGHLLMHLGMSGSLQVVDRNTEPRKHDHFDLVFANGKCLRLHDPRRFGSVLWTNEPPFEHKLLKDLGSEPLDTEFNAKYLWQTARKRKISIKQFIMDSHNVVGVGNIYASESLFRAGIHPRRAAGKVSLENYTLLVRAIKTVIKAAIKQGGTTLRDFTGGDGKPGYFQQRLNVYGRKGEPCRKCAKPISHCVMGQRATYYCTACQK